MIDKRSRGRPRGTGKGQALPDHGCRSHGEGARPETYNGHEAHRSAAHGLGRG